MADSRRQENKFLPFALFVNLNLFNLITLFWDCKLKFNNLTLTDILHALDLSWLSLSFILHKWKIFLFAFIKQP